MAENQEAQQAKLHPINLTTCVQNKARLQIRLYEDLVVEGDIVGFDEFMNIVLDNAEECIMETNTRSPLGTVILKGDHIISIQNVEGNSSTQNN